MTFYAVKLIRILQGPAKVSPGVFLVIEWGVANLHAFHRVHVAGIARSV